MAHTSKTAAQSLRSASDELTAIYYRLGKALKDGNTSGMKLGGKSIPAIMTEIDSAQRAILSIKNTMLQVDINVGY